MTHKRIRFLLGALAVLALFGATGAVQAAPLTDQQVKAYIASFPEIDAFTKKNHIDPPAPTGPDASMANFYDAGLEQVRAKGLYDKFGRTVHRHGFASPKQWAGVASRIAQAMMAIELGGQGANMKAQMEQAMQQIRANAQIPAEQKEKMLQQMRQTVAAFSSMAKSSDSDKKAVRPHLPALKKVMGD